MFCGPTHYRVDTAGMFYDSNSKAGKVLQHTKVSISVLNGVLLVNSDPAFESVSLYSPAQ